MPILKSVTKSEYDTLNNPILNKLFSIDDLIYEYQMQGLDERIFNPPLLVPVEVRQFWLAAPYNFSVTSTTQPNQMVLISKISWV